MNENQHVLIKRMDYYNKRVLEEKVNELDEENRNVVISQIIGEIVNLVPVWKSQYPEYPYYQIGRPGIHDESDKCFYNLEKARQYIEESMITDEDDVFVIWCWEDNVLPYVTAIVHDNGYFQRAF